MEETSNNLIDLPMGFRFHPTDEEIITHYLAMKVMDEKLTTIVMEEVDLNKYEPWDLPKKAKMGGKEWFFFCQTYRKYPSGTRTNRTTNTGYWKVTGKDKEIYMNKCKGGVTGSNGQLVGTKKTLVFYLGRAPKGEKTNWVMHEYRLQSNFHKGGKNEWAVCKVFHKNIRIELERNNKHCNLQPSTEDNISNCSTTHMTGYEEEKEFKVASSLKAKSTAEVKEEAAILPSCFFNINSNLSIPISSYPTDVFNTGSYNQPSSNPIFLDYQTLEYQNSSVYEAAATANEQYCKVEEFSSNNNSMVNVTPSQNTEFSSLFSDMQDLEYLWELTDY